MSDTLNETTKWIVEESDPNKIKNDNQTAFFISRQHPSKANRNRKIKI
jgi:hypothetical protein